MLRIDWGGYMLEIFTGYHAMTNCIFFITICLSQCLAAVTSAQEDAANPVGMVKNQAKNPYTKTLLLSADGKSAFAVQASQTDLGRQVSDFLLDHSRRIELSTFSREAFDERRQAPQKFVQQLLIDCQKKTKGAEAAEFSIILRMLNAERPIDAGVPIDEIDLTREEIDILRNGFLAKNLVLRSDGDIEILKWSDVSFDLKLFQFKPTGKRLRQIINNPGEGIWPSCLRSFTGDRHQLRVAKLEKGILCDSISSTHALSFRCAGTLPCTQHFSLFWIIDGNVNSILAPDHEKEHEPWLVISVR